MTNNTNDDCFTNAPEEFKKMQLDALHNAHQALIHGRLCGLVVISISNSEENILGIVCGDPRRTVAELEIVKHNVLEQFMMIKRQEAQKEALAMVVPAGRA